MKKKFAIGFITMAVALAVCWILFAVGLLGNLDISAVEDDTVPPLILAACRIVGAVVIIQALIMIGDESWLKIIIVGAIGVALLIFANVTAIFFAGIVSLTLPIVTIVIAGDRFTYISLWDDKLCKIIGYIFPVVMIAGSVLMFLANFSSSAIRDGALAWSATTGGPFAWAGISLALIGIIGWIVWTVLVIVKYGTGSNSSSRKSTGNSGVSAGGNKDPNKPVTSEKELKTELDYVARNCSRTESLGFGYSANYEISCRLYGRNIEFTVYVKLGSGSAKDNYELNKVKANLKRETDKLCSDVLASAKNYMAVMNLAHSYNLSVKVKS